MNLYENNLYVQDVAYTAELALPWNKLENKSIMISGASGLIGSFLVDTIMYRNKKHGMNTTIYALGRNEETAKKRFAKHYEDQLFTFVKYDINEPFVREDLGQVHYIIHLASNTHPVAYATDPIGTILTNVVGTKNLLDFACLHDNERFAFASSNEIYGENRGDIELYPEDYCGYIDCNTLRAGYPESKRCGETLCQAYIKQKGLDVVIPRLTRSYGPTLLKSDTKAMSQFLRNGLNKEDIVLKSEGKQYYSYTYVSDAVSGLLTVLLCGKTGEAYNIADIKSDITLRDLAKCIATYVGKEVVFQLPDQVETAGFSKATKARLDSTKLQELGWSAHYDMKQGIERTLDILSDCQ